MVGLGGLEPPTSPLSGARSSHLSYRPFVQRRQIVYHAAPLAQDIALKRCLAPLTSNLKSLVAVLLHETYVRRLPAALRSFLDWPELRLVTGDILSQRAPDALCVPRTYDHAGQQLPLRPIRENVNKIEGEFL